MDFSIARRRMVDSQLVKRGIADPLVLKAMGSLPRHRFVEEALQNQVYTDFALPIGEKQTISQPYIVALMTSALELTGSEKILEIGTGSGYQAAVLATISRQVYSIERLPNLARRARRILDDISLSHVQIKVSDGTLGWPELAPFDRIIVTAGGPVIPEEYSQQLSIGGKLVIPVGTRQEQNLIRVTRISQNEYSHEELSGCRFVPLIGAQGWGED